jgi:16S rRNA C967 or C1407 C5-methylase (RsmB/RsmF family)/NOL1/NOP2/fmu family ribosome biogenesis protein
MLPEEFVKRISQQEYLDTAGLVDALSRPAETSVRINPFKWPHAIESYERIIWEPDGYYLPGRPSFTPDPLFHAGAYYPQESSSMFTGELFRQLTGGIAGLRVLDLCGAPGGKSTHLSSLLPEDGLLVSNEVIRSRAAILAEVITKWGLGNTIVTQSDPARFAGLPGFFDVVVVDAPCSGEGMFRSDAVVREWSVQNAGLCSERQRRIVMDVWPALKPGGILIYSTCTFNPAENEENIAWIRDSTDAEPLTVTLPEGSPVMPVSHKGITGYGFHPGRVKGDGFFIAALRKNEGYDHSHREARKGTLKPSSSAFAIAEPLAVFDRDRITAQENRIIALAADTGLFGILADKVNVIKSGTMIGEVRKNAFVPAHDLAMSVRQKRGSWPEYELSYNEAIAYLRLDQIQAGNMPAGRVLMTYRGLPLGFVNNLGNRINNGYPQAWRIRMERQTGYREIL